MPRPYANDPQRLDRALSPGLLRVLLIAFGIALLIGMTSGALWIVYNLLRLHVFR
jgi:hypothetical protein